MHVSRKKLPRVFLLLAVTVLQRTLRGATVKAGTQERGTERGTEVSCEVRRK